MKKRAKINLDAHFVAGANAAHPNCGRDGRECATDCKSAQAKPGVVRWWMGLFERGRIVNPREQSKGNS